MTLLIVSEYNAMRTPQSTSVVWWHCWLYLSIMLWGLHSPHLWFSVTAAGCISVWRCKWLCLVRNCCAGNTAEQLVSH